MPNDSVLSNVAAPGTRVTVSLPALIISLRFCEKGYVCMKGKGNLRIDFILGWIRSLIKSATTRHFFIGL
jgi:hypothetical protein